MIEPKMIKCHTDNYESVKNSIVVRTLLCLWGEVFIETSPDCPLGKAYLVPLTTVKDDIHS